MIVYNNSKEPISLGKEFARGGEGAVYEIDDTSVAKIYFEPEGRLDKMNAFIKKNVSIQGVCAPKQLLFDERNRFVGYTMDKASGRSLQLSVFQPQLFKSLFPNWTKIELTRLALTILKKIGLLHDHNILVGDLNPFNINVVNQNEIYFLDTDSFQIDNYPCPVGTIDFTAPEIQGVNFTSFLRKKEHEYYAVATLLFMLYLPGKHPYSRSGCGEKQENIKNHDFVFPLGDEDEQATPKGQWEAIWYSLPYEIRKSFYNVFKNGERYPVAYWVKLLEAYLEELDSNAYSRSIFPMSSEFVSKNKTLNMNRRDITDKDKTLRQIETHLTTTTPPQKIAVIELSTKAVKLLIGKDPNIIKTTPFDFKLFYREGIKTNTGRGLDSKNVMDMHYFRTNVLPSIQKCRRVAIQEGVDCIYTVATAAYRTAANRDEIISCIREEAHINVCILKKQEEATATITAFQFSTSKKAELLNSPYVMMIDQGGGSTEVSLFNHTKYVDSYSINLGTEVLRTLLFKESTEQTTLRQALSMADKLIRDRLDAFYTNMHDIIPSDQQIFCISVGTAITTATGRRGNAKQHDCILTLDRLKEKVESIDSKLKENYTYASDLYHDITYGGTRGETIDREVVMRVGLPMFITLMTKFNIDQLTVSGTGLWYGIYFQKLFNMN